MDHPGKNNVVGTERRAIMEEDSLAQIEDLLGAVRVGAVLHIQIGDNFHIADLITRTNIKLPLFKDSVGQPAFAQTD